MSEPGAASIPTSASHRPNKKPRLNNTPLSQQQAQVQALFANPDRTINLDKPTPKGASAPPEIVTNVQGSSAGAGSGEFHVYKASRRREYERLRAMDEEVEREEADAKFERERSERQRKEEEQLAKKRAKRAKKSKAKARMEPNSLTQQKLRREAEGEEGVVKKRLGPRKDGNGERTEDGEGVVQDDGQAGGEEEAGITFHDDD